MTERFDKADGIAIFADGAYVFGIASVYAIWLNYRSFVYVIVYLIAAARTLIVHEIMSERVDEISRVGCAADDTFSLRVALFGAGGGDYRFFVFVAVGSVAAPSALIVLEIVSERVGIITFTV